jgi:asparagine synthase (glutamine-hydrolysing)
VGVTGRDAVAASLPATGDVSATLSGGLDSTMVAATAAELLADDGRQVHAMTHVPLPGTADPSGGWEASDGPYAEAMAATTPGMTWTGLVNAELTPPLAADAWIIDRTWQPPFNTINQVWFNEAIRRAEQRGDAVLLTGAAGNATFSRDKDGIVPNLIAERRWGALLRQVGARHRAGLSRRGAARSVAAEALPRLATRRRARRTPTPPDRLGAFDLPFRPEVISTEARAGLPQLDGTYSMDRDRWTAFALSDFSRIGMAQNASETVWWSDPLSDPALIALALRIPEEAWIANGRDRGLARDAGKGLVPDRIRLRSTRGAQGADAGAWLAGGEVAYRDLLEEFRASASVPQFLDLDRLEAAIGPRMTAPATAPTWQNLFGRAFSLGRFATWYEHEVLRGPAGPLKPSRAG